MSDFDDLDDLLGPLRGSATPAELASESEMVELMATTHRHAKGTIMFSSRRARVATLIAAGVIGFGGVAAAARPALNLTGLSDGVPTTTEKVEVEDEVDDDDETTTTVTTVVPQEIVVTTTIDDDDDDDDTLARVAAATEDVGADEDVTTTSDPYPETAFNEAYCLDGNHGKTVSAVARNDDELDDAVKDAEVRDAAHSKCGKMDDADEYDDDHDDADEIDESDEVDDDDDADEETTPQDAPAVRESTGNPGNHGNGNGNANQGNGNSGNGNGRSGKKND